MDGGENAVDDCLRRLLAVDVVDMRIATSKVQRHGAPVGPVYRQSDRPQFEIVCLLFYTITIVFHLYHGGDVMYEMRRNPKPTLLPYQRNFNLLHHIAVLAFDNAVTYTEQGNGLQHS